MSLEDTIIFKARKYANARASAGRRDIFKNGRFITGYGPKLAAEWVSLSDTPDLFNTRKDAVNEARKFKQKCKEYLDRRGLI